MPTPIATIVKDGGWSRGAAAPWRCKEARDIGVLAKSVKAGSASFARRREPSAKHLVPGKVVISGKTARRNKPSAKNGGVNLAEEVVPHGNVRLPRVSKTSFARILLAKGKLNIQRSRGLPEIQ